jgi:hypothetical protein
MIDSTIVALGYAFIAFAGAVSVLAVVGIVVAVRTFRDAPAEVVVSVTGPRHEMSRAA